MDSSIQVGDVVRFREVIDKGDDVLRMKVLEVEADRNWALCEAIVDNMVLKPTKAERLSDLVKA